MMRATKCLLATVFAFVALVSCACAQTFPTWGNTEIADCTFAAAADWMILDLGYTPSERTIIREFHKAGGVDEEGIYQDQFRAYWRNHGIAGVHAKLHEIPNTAVLLIDAPVIPNTSRARIERYLRRDHVLIAEWGDHEIVLNGITPTGFKYITYGEQREVSWHEWRQESEGVFTVSVIP